jgi:hypothetical protein
MNQNIVKSLEPEFELKERTSGSVLHRPAPGKTKYEIRIETNVWTTDNEIIHRRHSKLIGIVFVGNNAEIAFTKSANKKQSTKPKIFRIYKVFTSKKSKQAIDHAENMICECIAPRNLLEIKRAKLGEKMFKFINEQLAVIDVIES